MDLNHLLHSDLGTVARFLLRAWNWWWCEMQAMVPAFRLTARTKPSGRVIRPSGQGFIADDGTPPNVPNSGSPITLCLEAPAGLVRRMDLPIMPWPDLQRLIMMDLDRLTPFETNHILIDIAILHRDNHRQNVAVAILPRLETEATLHRAYTLGIHPDRLSLAGSDGSPCFNVLPQISGAANQARRIRYAWLMIGALLIINLALFVVREEISLMELRDQVDNLSPLVLSAQRLQAVIDADTRQRAALIARKQAKSPLPILDALTQGLPDQVWVQRLEWNGTTLRIVGWNRDSVETLPMIQALPLLSDLREETPTESETPQRGKPFDITAQAIEEARTAP